MEGEAEGDLRTDDPLQYRGLVHFPRDFPASFLPSAVPLLRLLEVVCGSMVAASSVVATFATMFNNPVMVGSLASSSSQPIRPCYHDKPGIGPGLPQLAPLRQRTPTAMLALHAKSSGQIEFA